MAFETAARARRARLSRLRRQMKTAIPMKTVRSSRPPPTLTPMRILLPLSILAASEAEASALDCVVVGIVVVGNVGEEENDDMLVWRGY